MNRKEKILLAMQVILQEYREKTHRATIGSCALCQKFYTESGSEERHPCHKCPMFIFTKKRKSKYDYHELSCLYRKCRPVFCQEGQKMTKGLHRVIGFYEKAIEGLQNLTNEDLGKKNAFKYLIDIDLEVYEKYSEQKKE